MSDITITQGIKTEIRDKGYSLVLAETMPLTLLDEWQRLLGDYDNLPRDAYLPDNGLYRYRRYDSFYFHPASGDLVLMPHTDYFQSRDINHVTGGIIRKFAPLTEETRRNPFMHELIRFDFETFPLDNEAWANESWQVDVHQIYVVADVGAEGHPTPEGVHRDGAAFVTVHLAVLENADGGTVSIYDDDKQHLESFTLQNVLDSYLFNDAILWHGVTPIRSHDGKRSARRGILTFDYHHKPNLDRPS